MFLGHFGVGFGAKAAAPRTSLGTLFLAAQFVDLLWPVLLLAGVEVVEIRPGVTRVTPLDFVSYPLSHSLAMGVVWGILLSTAYAALTRYRRGAIAIALLVPSHWLLDALVHRPDLPLAPRGELYAGLGLWASLAATAAVEAAFLLGGLALYLRRTRAEDGIGRWGLAGLVLLLVLIYAGNVLGPPPPSARAIAWVGHAQWLLVAIGWWVDRHRSATPPVLRVVP